MSDWAIDWEIDRWQRGPTIVMSMRDLMTLGMCIPSRLMIDHIKDIAIVPVVLK